MKSLGFLVFMALVCVAKPLGADEQKVGLVLSGGGARGLAHIGVIRALEEQDIRIHAIAGTSMGAVVGALYASGRTSDEIEQIALTMDWAAALDDLPPREHMSFRRKQDSRGNTTKAQATVENGVFKLPKGVVQGQTLQIILQQQFLHVSDITDFDNLAIPFRAVAGDLVTGSAHIFDSGSLATAVRASMSIPGVFAPVELEGKMLADGGIANNLPVDVVKSMGVDRVIAVDIQTPLYTAEQLNSVLPIIEQLTTLLTFNQIKDQYRMIGEDDLLVEPNLDDINTAAFEKTETAIERGYEAMMAHREKLADYRSTVIEPINEIDSFDPPVIDRIVIDNTSDISNEFILANIHQVTGEAFDEEQLRRDIDTIYGYEYFEFVKYDIEDRDDGHVLRITVTEKSWGKDLLGLKLNLFTDTRAETSYNLGATYRMSGVTKSGGEWFTGIQVGEDPSISTELYVPLDYRQRMFVKPYGRLAERLENHVVDGDVRSRIEIDETLAGMFVGAEFSNKAIFGFGAETHQGEIHTVIGDPTSTIEFNDDVYYAKLEYDTLDNLAFPGYGAFSQFQYSRVDASHGFDNYDMFRAGLTYALPLARDSLVFNGRYIRSNGPVGRHRQPFLGGIKNLSGLHRNDLVNNNLAYLSLTYLHRFDERSVLPLDLPVYFGFALETGNTWENTDDIAFDDMIESGVLMMGLDTPVGPVYVGYGRTETDRSAFYIQLGHLIYE